MLKKILGAIVILLLSQLASAQQPSYSIFNDTNDLVSINSFLASRGSWVSHSITPHQTFPLTLPVNEPYAKIRVNTANKGYVEYDVKAGSSYRIFYNPSKRVLDLVSTNKPIAAPVAQTYQQQSTQQFQPQANQQNQGQTNSKGIPPGTYLNSCQNIFWSGNMENLFAICLTQNGTPLMTALLNANNCLTSIENVDGYMRCQLRTGRNNQEIRVIYVNNRLQSTQIRSVLVKDPNGQKWGEYSTRAINPNDRQMIWLERQLPCSLYLNVDQRQVALMDTCNKRQFWQFDQSYRID